MNKTEKLTVLLKNVSERENVLDLNKSELTFLSKLDPLDLAEAQGRLIESGVAVSDLYEMFDKFSNSGVVEDQIELTRKKLPSNHLMRYLLLEHEYSFAIIEDLKEACSGIVKFDKIKTTSNEYRRLYEASRTLAQTKLHMDFEDDVLYPTLKNYSKINFFEHVKAEHLYLNIATEDLFMLVRDVASYGINDFKINVSSTVEYLCSTMKEHIFIENSIIYPIILDSCKDKDLWKYMKDLRSDMGYSLI